ncbi:MAG: metallophosphoesterase family protein [Bacteroidota bacterium]
MKLLILSDIHDHVYHLEAVLKVAPQVDHILVCGDLCSPFVLVQLQQALTQPIHIVFGNNDGDTYRMTKLAAEHVHLYGEFASLEFDDCHIAMTHYPDIAAAISGGNEFDLVCYGHNHIWSAKKVEGTILCNPGTMMGYNPGTRGKVSVSFALYETKGKKLQHWELETENRAVRLLQNWNFD